MCVCVCVILCSFKLGKNLNRFTCKVYKDFNIQIYLLTLKEERVCGISYNISHSTQAQETPDWPINKTGTKPCPPQAKSILADDWTEGKFSLATTVGSMQPT